MRMAAALLLGLVLLGCSRGYVVGGKVVLLGRHASAVDIEPAQLARVAPFASRGAARRAGDTPDRPVAVRRSDGRTVMIDQRFDALVIPDEGPSRLYRRPVAARVESGVLFVSGANRPESAIPLARLHAILVLRR